MKGKTVVDAAAEWVNGFNAVRYGMIETLMKAFPNDWSELTTPSYGDRVCVWDGENDGQRGVIVEDRYDKEPDLHRIEFDNKELGDVILAEDEFEVDGIRLMSECGFRIYEHEEWGYFFGIDGMGYSFMDEHWEPLYRARSLQWHDEKAEHERQMLKMGYKKGKLGNKRVWLDKENNVVEEVK